MGSWWRTMRIRQTRLPPFAVRCVSCQEPHRFSQNLESQSQPRRFYYRGTTDYTDVTGGTFELRHTFVIRHFPNNSPGRPLLRPLDSTLPVTDGHGNGPPQTTIKPTIRKQL